MPIFNKKYFPIKYCDVQYIFLNIDTLLCITVTIMVTWDIFVSKAGEDWFIGLLMHIRYLIFTILSFL